MMPSLLEEEPALLESLHPGGAICAIWGQGKNSPSFYPDPKPSWIPSCEGMTPVGFKAFMEASGQRLVQFLVNNLLNGALERGQHHAQLDIEFEEILTDVDRAAGAAAGEIHAVALPAALCIQSACQRVGDRFHSLACLFTADLVLTSDSNVSHVFVIAAGLVDDGRIIAQAGIPFAPGESTRIALYIAP